MSKNAQKPQNFQLKTIFIYLMNKFICDSIKEGKSKIYK